MTYDDKKIWNFTTLSDTFGKTPMEKVETAIVVMDRKLAEAQLLLKNRQYIDALTSYIVITDLAMEARGICKWKVADDNDSKKCLKLITDEMNFVDDELENSFKQVCDHKVPPILIPKDPKKYRKH